MGKSNMLGKLLKISNINLEPEIKEILGELAENYQVSLESNLGDRSQKSLSSPNTFVTFDIARYSNNAAKAWMCLRPKTRQTLLKHIRDFTGLNEGQVIARAYQLFAGLASIPSSLNEIKELNEKILKNQEKIIDQLGTIVDRLGRIESKLDEQILVIARKSLRHLINGANTNVSRVRSQQLQLASDGFSQLTELNPNEVTRGVSSTIKNVNLIVIGYWGNHLYFGIQKDLRNALIQVYESTSQYPLESLQVFSSNYYSQDYQKDFDLLFESTQEKIAELRVINVLNNYDIDQYNSKKGWQAFKGLVGGLGVAALGTFLGQPHLGGIGAYSLYQNLVGQVSTPHLRDTKKIQESINEIENKVKLLAEKLITECKEQQKILQLITGDDLNRISASRFQ